MEVPPGPLRWQCRRGMKELDLLLQGWLDLRYPWASGAERALFARFLELPDPQLACYLLRHETPDDPELAALVTQLAPGGAQA